MSASAEIMLGRKRFEAKGIAYEVKALPLKFILSKEFSEERFIIPTSKEHPGVCQIYNLDDESRRARLDLWLSRLLMKEQKPMSLEQIAEDEWDIEDLGRFLLEVVQISG